MLSIRTGLSKARWDRVLRKGAHAPAVRWRPAFNRGPNHPMARPRSPGFNDQRDLIVAKAAGLFARRGYLGTTISDVTEACGLQKPTLYHYFKDKEELLMSIADLHVSKLFNLVHDVESRTRPGPERLQSLITRFLSEYANAQDAHRVLTEDVKYLADDKRSIIADKERQVVAAFSSAIAATRPDIKRAKLEKPVAMLLFGMLNWMFTWLRPEGRLTHADMAPVVVQLFVGGLEHIALPLERKSRR